MHSKRLNFAAVMAVVWIALAVMPGSLQAAERFVALSGSDETGDGSQINPYRTIAYADRASGPGDTITVMPGQYMDKVTYLKDVYVRSQMGPDTTILSGGRVSSLFILGKNSGSATIEGFTIKGGMNAIRIQNCSPTIKDNKFLGCVADTTIGAGSNNGAAINMFYSRAEIYDNYFEHNAAYGHGGAVYAASSQPQIYNNVFESNAALGSYNHGGAVMIEGNYLESGAIVIQNNIFSNNSSDLGGALSVASDSCYIYNNVFYGNQSSSNFAGGLLVEYRTVPYNPYVYNNIFMNNTPDGMRLSDSTITNYGNNDYFGNSPNRGCSGCPDTENTFYLNPRFVDPANGDFHLTDSSELINKGISPLPHFLGFDFDNQRRVIADNIDLGADEFADCNLSGDFAALADTIGCPGLSVRFTALNLQGYYDSLTWNFGDGASAYNTLNPSHVYTDTGHFKVELLMTTPCATAAISKNSYIHIMDAPAPAFHADQLIGCVPHRVSFENLTAGAADSCLWDFGDGTASQETDPVHVYQEPGAYTVKLTTYNRCGQDSVVAERFINAISGPVSEFSAVPEAGSAPLTVNFTDQSLYSPLTWFWEYGDGGSDADRNPSYRYNFPGIYDVMLITENRCGIRPDTLIKQGFITIYGFESKVYNVRETSRYAFHYDFYEDSLYGRFGRTIRPRAAMSVNPSRGNVTFSFGDSTLSLFDSTTLHATLSKDVPRGTYDFYLITTGSGGAPADTVPLQFTSASDSLLETSPLALDFGEVPQDSTKTLILTIRNNIQFPDTFSVTVANITTAPQVFTSDFSGQFSLDATAKTSQIPVSFTPSELGPVNGVLAIYSNDPAYPQWNVNLSATGVLERTPPAVDSTRPYVQEKEYAVTDSLTIYFSEPIDQSTMQPGSITITSLKTGRPVEGEWAYDPDKNVVAFKPAEGFAILDSVYVVVNGNIADLAGNVLDGNGDGGGTGAPGDNYVFNFTTGLAVYPGDANNDGIVNEMDALPLGVYWENSGDLRPGDVRIWSRQAVRSWNPVRATYADCNGDGIVNRADIEVIQSNWGQTHVIEGSPTVFTMDELSENTENFNEVYKAVEHFGAGESGAKMRDLLSGYITESANVEQFSLGRNFPNPFNPITTIDFTIPRECHVTLEVYNVLGQTVKMLVDEKLPPGYRTVTWDGTDDNGSPVPSGVYFYRMTADEFSEVRKMLLIR